MYWLTKEIVEKEFPTLVAEYGQLPVHVRDWRHPLDSSLGMPDYATLLQRGWRWLFEGMQQHQPKAFAAAEKSQPILLFGERFAEGHRGKQYWCNLLLRLGDRYLVVRPEYRGDTFEELGAKHIDADFLLSLPEPLASAYYARSCGIACEIELPYFVVGVSRVLPHPSGVISSALRLVGARKAEQHTAAVALRRLTGQSGLSDQELLKLFRLLLDTRHPDAPDSTGDLLFVRENDPHGQVIMIPGLDFAGARFLEKPVAWMDDYVSRVLRFE